MPLDQIIPLQKGTHNNLQQTQWEASFLESIQTSQNRFFKD
ncbi:hypothetical protein ACEW7V_01205 [Areca yellow leaf disease phytoplasma]